MYIYPLSVTVAGNSNTMFRGVLCQVRKSSDASIILGTFALNENEAKLKLMTCTNTDNSVTHLNNSDVNTVSFKWMPPMGDMGNVKLM